MIELGIIKQKLMPDASP